MAIFFVSRQPKEFFGQTGQTSQNLSYINEIRPIPYLTGLPPRWHLRHEEEEIFFVPGTCWLLVWTVVG